MFNEKPDCVHFCHARVIGSGGKSAAIATSAVKKRKDAGNIKLKRFFSRLHFFPHRL